MTYNLIFIKDINWLLTFTFHSTPFQLLVKCISIDSF